MCMYAAMPNRAQVRKALLRTLGCAFFGYHMLAVAVANLAPNTKVRDLPHRWLRPYATFFGQWQEWDMFTTIPYYAEIHPTLVATNADNSTTDYGPWLPGLEPAPESLKVTSLFARIQWSRNSFGSAIAHWERAACAAIHEQTTRLPKSVHLRLDTQRINPLQTIRFSKQIAHPEHFTTKPTMCRK
jgi:hypothetical protein